MYILQYFPVHACSGPVARNSEGESDELVVAACLGEGPLYYVFAQWRYPQVQGSELVCKTLGKTDGGGRLGTLTHSEKGQLA
jgi:hypothetical protein